MDRYERDTTQSAQLKASYTEEMSRHELPREKRDGMHSDTSDGDGRETMRAAPVSAGRKKMRTREKMAKG